MIKKNQDIISILKKWLSIIVVVAYIGELIFFPGWDNALGGFMAIFCWIIYSNFFLKRQIILFYPFAFLIITTLFLYRYIPLIATLIEWKPITYNMVIPFETFLYEILLFIVASIAFYWACPKKINIRNNLLQKALKKTNFFSIDNNTIWVLGIIGLILRIYTFSQQEIEYGDVSGKFIFGLKYLIYAPIILFFPKLLNLPRSNNKLTWGYLILLTIINIASNSRLAMIMPLGTFILLFLLNIIKNKTNLYHLISPGKIVILVLFIVFGLNILSDLSLAMLYNRNLRKEITKKELLYRTIQVYNDNELMNYLRVAANSNNSEIPLNSKEWDETYINNFMLNRYANVRVSDLSLHYAKQNGFKYDKMQEFIVNQTLALLPTPILKFLGVSINKGELAYSPGDLLSGSLGSYRVASHVAIGLSAFGYWYFPIQLLIFFIMFKLLNGFIYKSKQGLLYAPFALMNVFIYMGMARNSAGVINDISFILRGFIEGIITYLIIYGFVKLFMSPFNKNRPSITKIVKTFSYNSK